jgi:hypothetical protein
MATSRELKELLRPLLVRRSDLAFIGRTLFFQPFTHYLRGVEFMTSRFHSASQAVSFAHQLYNGQDCVDFHSGPGRHRYQMKLEWKDSLVTASKELCEEMELRALPPVEPIIDYVEHQKAAAYLKGLDPRAPVRVFLLALGDCSVGAFGAAETKLSEFERYLPEYSADLVAEEHRYERYPLWRMAYLLRTLRKDRSQVLPLLHDWEAFAVKSSKLTRYWKPTPFPCET